MISFSSDYSIMYCGIIFKKFESAVVKGEKKKQIDDQFEEEVVHLAVENRGCEECISLCLSMLTGTEFFQNLNQPNEEQYNLVAFADHTLDHLNLEDIVAKSFPRIKLVTREFYYDLTHKRAKYEGAQEPSGKKKADKKEKDGKKTKEIEKNGLDEVSILVCTENETFLKRSEDSVKSFGSKMQVTNCIITQDPR